MDSLALFLASRDPQKVAVEQFPPVERVIAEVEPAWLPTVEAASIGELRRRVLGLEGRLLVKQRGARRVVATPEVVEAYKRVAAENKLLRLRLAQARRQL